MTEQLAALVKARGHIKAAVTKFKTYCDSLGENSNVTETRLRVAKFEKNWDEFNTIQIKIEELDESNVQINERDSFEQHYFELTAKCEDFISHQRSANSYSNNSTPTSVPEQSVIQLPRLSLPHFSGQYQQWISFFETFNSLIHNDCKLNNIQKFHYLKSCLKNEAAALIQDLGMSHANYSIAVELLKERYENKRLIIKNHVRALCNLPMVVKDSAESLRNLLNICNLNLKLLKNLNQPVEHWDLLLIENVTNKLDYKVIHDWEACKIAGDVPTFKELTDFLNDKCQLFEALSLGKPNPGTSNVNNKADRYSNKYKPQRVQNSATHLTVSRKITCLICKQEHYTNQCEELLKLPLESRISEITKRKLCTNCLRDNHSNEQCKSLTRCKQCKGKHHTLIHGALTLNDSNIEIVPSSTVSNYAMNHKNSQILLSTALLSIQGGDGKFNLLRALLDTGSQSNFITTDAFKRLKLQSSRHISMPITGINNSISHVNNVVDLNIKSHVKDFSTTCSFLVINTITDNLPLKTFNRTRINIPKNIQLADPLFNKSAQIDLLIGAQVLWDLIISAPFKTGVNAPYLYETKFGWVIGGNLSYESQEQSENKLCHLSIQSIDKQIKKFWEIEDCNLYRQSDSEQSLCEQSFITTHTRDHSGRFVVTLPFKSELITLGNSYDQALNRFHALERKLNKNHEMKVEYHNFMKQYITLGHMSEVPVKDLDVAQEASFYLPHHAVIKESSATTRLRVVFDGSMKTSNGVSLNDTLLVGPNIQDDLFCILTRFRTFKYAFTADVIKMYRMILITPKDRNFQRILWRNNQNEPVKIFILNTVTYGTTPSAFLAIRSLKQLALDHKLDYPLAHNAILNNFYVDDLLSGANDMTEAIALQEQINKVLAKGGFKLQKWASNDIRLASQNGEGSKRQVDLNKEVQTKILGLIWDSDSDRLRYSIRNCENKPVTKRNILSVTAQLFDPLGLIGPVIVTAKIILQTIWSLQVDWDAPLPNEINVKWQEFMSQLPALKELKLDRKLIDNHEPNSIYEVHGFCDASQVAYGACVYLRVRNSDGTTSVNLIAAKTRVAPLKKLTIPRLELCGAFLLAKLINKIKTVLNLDIRSCHYWTDSTIVISWLSASPHNWKVFVANRLREIQSLTDSTCWHHINGRDNPADILSRGLTPRELINSQLWWHGPKILCTESLPQFERLTEFNELPERRVIHISTNDAEIPVFTQVSNFSKLRRIIAYCLRFSYNLKNSKSRKINHLSCRELDNAKITIIKYVQGREFAQEINALRKRGSTSNTSKLKSLSPFIDESGVLRVGGRLKNSLLHFNTKHPSLLPANHHVTKIIIREVHELNFHAGQQATLAFVRQGYWPLSGRSVVRKALHDCIRCFRANPVNTTQPMGQLPLTRITQSRPFLKSGIDFAGPIYVKRGPGRTKGTVKAYVALFVCLATKATHIELVGDLTTATFINALKRFTARRGLVTDIYCDNATNFKGAQRELRELQSVFYNKNNEMLAKSVNLGLTWHFSPPRAPHFGGIWEAGVKSAKRLLKRILANALTTCEEMYTLLAGIEAILNSRPLIPLSNDPNDLQALTPGHFLIGDALNAFPEPDLSHLKINRLSRWQHIEKLRQDFWKRWSTEYLTNLQTNHKWTSNRAFIYKVGMLVLIREDNQPPLQWKMGRITELHPGRDSVTRVVSVRTSHNEILRRATAKVCVLPIDEK